MHITYTCKSFTLLFCVCVCELVQLHTNKLVTSNNCAGLSDEHASLLRKERGAVTKSSPVKYNWSSVLKLKTTLPKRYSARTLKDWEAPLKSKPLLPGIVVSATKKRCIDSHIKVRNAQENYGSLERHITSLLSWPY